MRYESLTFAQVSCRCTTIFARLFGASPYRMSSGRKQMIRPQITTALPQGTIGLDYHHGC